MAVTIDYTTFVINVPRTDMSLVQLNPTEIRTLDLNWFRLQLKAIEDNEIGMAYPDTTTHNTEVALGGLTYARVIEILDPYTITFEDGTYAVNLSGANSNVGDRVNVNNVSVRSANSAGLISSSDIEYSSFNGGVTIDVINGFSGTGQTSNGANIGTPRAPSNNAYDAKFIADTRGFSTFYIIGDIDIPEYEINGIDPLSISDFTFIGSGKSSTTINIPDITNMSTCKYYDAHILGTLDGFNSLQDCLIDNLHYIKGYLDSCVLSPGVITLGGNDTAHFLDCFSGVPGEGTPIIDFGGAGQALTMRNYNGGIQFQNKTGIESVSIDMNSGQIKIDLTTVINGTILVRGIGKVIESNTGEELPTGYYGDLYILNEAMNQGNISSAVWDEPIKDHLLSGTTGRSIGVQQYGNTIHIGTNGTSGTVFPQGTGRHPVDNIVDALSIAIENGITNFTLTTDFTVTGGVFLNYSIQGRGRQSPTLTVDNVKLNGMVFENMRVTGTFEDTSTCGFKNCTLYNVYDVSITAENCVLDGEIRLGGVGESNFYSCFDGVPGVGIPDIKVSACSQLGIWNWNGGIRLSDITTVGTVISLMIGEGRLWVDSTCVEGDIIVKGMADLRGETGGTTIDGDGLVTKDTFSSAVLDRTLINHQEDDTVGLIFSTIAYDGKVFIDTTSIEAGTQYPIGTKDHPVNNLTDALIISSKYGAATIHCHSNITIDNTYDIRHLTFSSHTRSNTITLINIDVHDATFVDVVVTGSCYGRATYLDCLVVDVNGLYGHIDSCMIEGELYINETSADALFTNCTTKPIGCDVYVYDNTMIMTNTSGMVTIKDLTTGIVGLTGGFCRFVLDSSCIGGTAAIGTHGQIIDNSTGTNIILETSITPEGIANEVWSYERTP